VARIRNNVYKTVKDKWPLGRPRETREDRRKGFRMLWNLGLAIWYLQVKLHNSYLCTGYNTVFHITIRHKQ
jgi:hypothetical protein